MSPALPWVGDINCFFLCLDFLPVTEGYSYVVLGVDGDVITQGSECIKREFRQGIRCLFEESMQKFL